MTVSTEFQQIILMTCAVIVAISAAISVKLLAELRSEVRRALWPTDNDRAGRLQAQARANRALLETPTGRESLVDFFVSEANISAFFREAEEKVLETNSDDELERLLTRLKNEEEKKPWYSVDRLKKGAKAIGEKLFDKANDLIKPYIGGGSSD